MKAKAKVIRQMSHHNPAMFSNLTLLMPKVVLKVSLIQASRDNKVNDLMIRVIKMSQTPSPPRSNLRQYSRKRTPSRSRYKLSNLKARQLG